MSLVYAQTVTVTYTYDQGPNGVGRLSSVTEQNGATVTGSTAFTYDVRGNLEKKDRTIDGGPTVYSVQSKYDSLNRLSELIYPDGEVIRYHYNDQSLLEQVQSITFETDYVSNFDYNAMGQVIFKDLGNAETVTYVYHPSNFRLTSLNTPGLQSLTYAYDKIGNVESIYDSIKGDTQIFGYDSLDRLMSATGNINPAYNYLYGYDTIGNITTIGTSGGSWNIQLVDSEGITGWYPSLAVDSVGNAHISYFNNTNADLMYARWNGSAWEIQSVDMDGSVGGNPSIALDGSGNPHISYLDYSNGDLKYAHWTGVSWSIEVVDSAGGVGAATSLALDSFGNPHISYQDFTNADLKFARWDGSSWIIETVDNQGDLARSTSLALNSAGNPHISYYDFTNKRLKYAKRTGGTWNLEVVDDLTTFSNIGQHSALALDNAGNPHISYSFDDSASQLKYAKWTGSSWAFDIVDIEGGSWSSITLDGAGTPHISYHSGGLKYGQRVGSGWVLQAVESNTGSPNSARPGFFGTSIAVDSTGSPQIAYSVFSVFDLKHASIDINTNTMVSPVPGSLQPHAPISDGTSSYLYDANGNMTTKTTGSTIRTFVWNIENRLRKVVQDGATLAEFFYDENGQRIKKTAGSLTSFYIDDLYECAGTNCTKYFFSDKQRIASRPVNSSDVHYYYGDHLGSTSVVTNLSNQKIQELAYFPYGEIRDNSLDPMSGVAHKFTDQELDFETGLYYYGARYYDPSFMHFISPDPVESDRENPQTLNLYSYVLNNPLKYTDPTGESPALVPSFGRIVSRFDRGISPIGFSPPKVQIPHSTPGAPLSSDLLTRPVAVFRCPAEAGCEGIVNGIMGLMPFGMVIGPSGGAVRGLINVKELLRGISSKSVLEGMSNNNLMHTIKHLSQFKKLAPSMTPDKLRQLGASIVKAKNFISQPGGRKVFEAKVILGGKNITIRSVLNPNNQLRSINIRRKR